MPLFQLLPIIINFVALPLLKSHMVLAWSERRKGIVTKLQVMLAVEILPFHHRKVDGILSQL